MPCEYKPAHLKTLYVFNYKKKTFFRLVLLKMTTYPPTFAEGEISSQ